MTESAGRRRIQHADRCPAGGADRPVASRPGHASRRAASSAGPPDLASLPASSGQEQMWFLEQLAPGRAAYNIPCAVELRGPLDVAALSRAVAGAAARGTRRCAPGWWPARTAGRCRRSIRSRATCCASWTTAPARTTGAAECQPPGPGCARWPAAELVRPFDLARGPLLRAWLVTLGTAEHVLLVTVHHAVFDGWSAGLLLSDLAALYRAEVTGEPSGLAELPVQFADFAVWERGRLSGAVLTELQDYWRGALDGVATLAMPDRPAAAIGQFLRRSRGSASGPGRAAGGPARAEPAAGLHAVRHADGRAAGAAAPLHRADRRGRRHGQRQPEPARARRR